MRAAQLAGRSPPPNYDPRLTYAMAGQAAVNATLPGGGDPSAGVALSTTIAASEDLADRAIANLWANAGAANVRNASAGDDSKPGHAVVIGATASGDPATLALPGQVVDGFTGLSEGAAYFLDTVAGGLTTIEPAASGQAQQFLGVAVSDTALLFIPAVGGGIGSAG